MQAAHLSAHGSLQNSTHIAKEPTHENAKEVVTKKSQFSKKGLAGTGGGTKVESTSNSTKKLIFSFKKDSKGNAKIPASTPGKNNVFVQHRRVQSHGQA